MKTDENALNDYDNTGIEEKSKISFKKSDRISGFLLAVLPSSFFLFAGLQLAKGIAMVEHASDAAGYGFGIVFLLIGLVLINIPFFIYGCIHSMKNKRNTLLGALVFWQVVTFVLVLFIPKITAPIYSKVNLLAATSAQNFSSVKMLVGLGVDVNQKDEDGKTALMRAVGRDNIEIVEFLIKNGADINTRDRNDQSALSIAYDRKNTKIIKLLERYSSAQ